MAWIPVPQRKTWTRPAGDVRVGVSDVRSTRLINIILADQVLAAAGLAIKDGLVFERGTGDHAGWVRVVLGSGETRSVGKLPQTRSGIVRFTLPPELPLDVAASTACDEWETGKGWVALRIPAAVMEGRAAPAKVKKTKAKAAAVVPAIRPAIPLVEPKKQTARDHALSLLRSRVSTDQVVRATGLSPRDVVQLAEEVKAERTRAAG